MKEDKGFSWPKAAVIATGIVASSIGVESGNIPPVVLFSVVAGSICVMSFPQIRDLLKYLLSKDEAEEEEECYVGDWVTHRLKAMLERYKSGRHLIEWQTPFRTMPDVYKTLGRNASTYSRRPFTEEDFKTEFVGTIEEILAAAGRNVQYHKSLIYASMKPSAPSFQPQQR